VIHTVIWDPTEPTATRPLLLQTSADWYTYGFDQVKNVTELFDSSGNIAAAYDYGPFGENMTASGPAAALNPFRFSSEVWDETLGLVQYNYRPYNPFDGRFTTRDPIEERGGLNLYGLVGNSPANRIDRLGLFSVRPVAGSPRVKTNTDGSFGGLWASIVILPDAGESLSGIVLHLKHTESHVTDCRGKNPVDLTQTVQKRISASGSAGWLLESGQYAPIYSNVAVLGGSGKCTKGRILVKAVWYHFADPAGLPPRGLPAKDSLSGSLDDLPSHGDTDSSSGWPSVPGDSYADFASLSIEVNFDNCPDPSYDVRASGRGLDSTYWEQRKGRSNDEAGSSPYDEWYD
jgi:RHS repeat-associated protein